MCEGRWKGDGCVAGVYAARRQSVSLDGSRYILTPPLVHLQRPPFKHINRMRADLFIYNTSSTLYLSRCSCIESFLEHGFVVEALAQDSCQ